MNVLEQLIAIRDYAGPRQTVGLTDATLERFLQRDPTLAQAINEASASHEAMRAEWGEHLQGDEATFTKALQQDYVNFYDAATVNPYVALAAGGRWIVTSHGAVLHDNGGYGMLGQGHAPAQVLSAMTSPWVMANVMTPSITHKRFSDRLKV